MNLPEGSDDKEFCVSSENGKPLIYCKFDCGMTEFALTKTLENHFQHTSNEIIEED
jgi:hypothetical protein